MPIDDDNRSEGSEYLSGPEADFDPLLLRDPDNREGRRSRPMSEGTSGSDWERDFLFDSVLGGDANVN